MDRILPFWSAGSPIPPIVLRRRPSSSVLGGDRRPGRPLSQKIEDEDDDEGRGRFEAPSILVYPPERLLVEGGSHARLALQKDWVFWTEAFLLVRGLPDPSHRPSSSVLWGRPAPGRPLSQKIEDEDDDKDEDDLKPLAFWFIRQNDYWLKEAGPLD